MDRDDKFPDHYTYVREDAAIHFIHKITLFYEILKAVLPSYSIDMSDKDKQKNKNQDVCELCKCPFKTDNDKIKHHDQHLRYNN